MATQNSTQATPGTFTPARRLVAAGIKRGAGPLVVEQPQLSAADKAAHAAASYVRQPSAA
ncbi:hypothetical protein ACIQWN_28880 [Streptomyces vinaceus]|uniref:hypothetical protein n=1 Tax=Streptomyces vinaceus TaxID=1960 RepID=UPI0037F3770C